MAWVHLTCKLVFSFFFFLLLRKINHRGAPFPLRLSPTFNMLSSASVIIRGHLLLLRLLSATCILHPQHPLCYTFLPVPVCLHSTINSCLEKLRLIHWFCDGYTHTVNYTIIYSTAIPHCCIYSAAPVRKVQPLFSCILFADTFSITH